MAVSLDPCAPSPNSATIQIKAAKKCFPVLPFIIESYVHGGSNFGDSE